MKEKRRAFRCREGQAILERRSETHGNTVMEFSCIGSGFDSTRGSYCLPKPDSRYVSCQTHACPEGYHPAGIHVVDTHSGREGFGFSCVAEKSREPSENMVQAWAATAGFPD